MPDIVMAINPDGRVLAVYTEEIDFNALGKVVNIRRASHVEPGPDGWYADMSPMGGGKLGPYEKRSDALAAEVEWLKNNLKGARA